MTPKSQVEWQELTEHRFEKAKSYAAQGEAFLAIFWQEEAGKSAHEAGITPLKLSTTEQKKMYGKAVLKGESFAAQIDTWLAYFQVRRCLSPSYGEIKDEECKALAVCFPRP